MKIIYLGQAGLLFETDGKRILVDPYLSDSVAKIEPQNERRQPIDDAFFELTPNVIVVTHNHADHLDKETLCRFLNEQSEVTCLAPNGSWQELRKFGGLKNNYVLWNDGTTWTAGNVVFRAVKAEHSDAYAVGLLLTAEGKSYYVTGDTLYSECVFASLPNVPIEALFLPINGVGNNMNETDAAKFAERVRPRRVVPVHFGMFDDKNGTELKTANVVVPKIYKEIIL